MSIRLVIERIRRFVARYTVCKLRKHRSTGLMLWWMCDRCHADFSHNAAPSMWIGNEKITVSK